MKPIQLIVISILLGAAGQIFIKTGVVQAEIVLQGPVLYKLLRILSMPNVWLGLGLYLFSTLVWLLVLSRVELSYAYPLISLSYIAVLLVSWLILKENVSLMRWAGVGVICLGVMLVSRS